jgi:hypothetical protein
METDDIQAPVADHPPVRIAETKPPPEPTVRQFFKDLFDLFFTAFHPHKLN